MLDLKDKILYTLAMFSLIGYGILAAIAVITGNFIIVGILVCIAILVAISAIAYVPYVVWFY